MASTSAQCGIDAAAPERVTAMALATVAIFNTVSLFFPSKTECRKKPINVSPAPVVSTVCTLQAPMEIVSFKFV